MVLDVEQARRLAHALEEHPEPYEIERSVVEHGATEESQSQLRRVLYAGVERVEIPRVHCLRFRGPKKHMKLVDHLPNLEAHHLADRTSVLARGLDRSTNRDRVLVVESEVSLDGFRVAERLEAEAGNVVGLLAGHDDHGMPATTRGKLRVERERRGDLQHTRCTLCALDVTSKPKAMISDAGDHVGSCSTQVSLEPPP